MASHWVHWPACGGGRQVRHRADIAAARTAYDRQQTDPAA